MVTADYIREIDFSTSMSGYKKIEVDDFLDEVADAFDNIVKENEELKSKIGSANVSAQPKEEVKAEEAEENIKPEPTYKAEEKDYTATTASVSNILESAQRFTDQLINEAKEKAETIIGEATLKAKQISEEIAKEKAEHEAKIKKDKEEVEAQIAGKLKIAAEKSEGIITAAKDSVARQQLLFDKLKAEAEIFKSKLLDNYKTQLELLNKFPKEVPFNAERAAEAVEFIVDNKPDFNSFIPNTEEEPEVKEAKPQAENTESENEEENEFFGGLKNQEE